MNAVMREVLETMKTDDWLSNDTRIHAVEKVRRCVLKYRDYGLETIADWTIADCDDCGLDDCGLMLKPLRTGNGGSKRCKLVSSYLEPTIPILGTNEFDT